MEGRLHKLFKGVVKKELLEENYVVYLEPSEPPLERLRWKSYRPDVLGIISDTSTFNLALAECETSPNSKRILTKTSKIKQTLALQKQLNESHIIRPLLIIPPMKLDKINCPAIRRFWEIWIINPRGKITHKIPRKTNK